MCPSFIGMYVRWRTFPLFIAYVRAMGKFPSFIAMYVCIQTTVGAALARPRRFIGPGRRPLSPHHKRARMPHDMDAP